MENTRIVNVAGAKVTVIDELTMKHRNQLRRIRRIAQASGAEPDTAAEFGLIVVRTVVIDGDLWKPPSATAPEHEILAGFEYMLENVTGKTIDAWLIAMASEDTDPSTGPIAPTDPNS